MQSDTIFVTFYLNLSLVGEFMTTVMQQCMFYLNQPFLQTIQPQENNFDRKQSLGFSRVDDEAFSSGINILRKYPRLPFDEGAEVVFSLSQVCVCPSFLLLI